MDIQTTRVMMMIVHTLVPFIGILTVVAGAYLAMVAPRAGYAAMGLGAVLLFAPIIEKPLREAMNTTTTLLSWLSLGFMLVLGTVSSFMIAAMLVISARVLFGATHSRQSAEKNPLTSTNGNND